MSNQPENEKVETVIRRRPTRRHRRNRVLRRVALAALSAGLAFGLTSVALLHLSPSLFRASRSAVAKVQAIDPSRNLLLLTQQESFGHIESRPAYSYSVVSGGVRDASELKWAAEHDPVVASHYAGFDYDRARVVRLVLARTAYVSYRIGNHVYWTRHRISLKKGETIITDGKMTARSRCGNRLEEAPQKETSSLEPPAARFDQPALPVEGTAISSPPVPFESALLNRPGLPGFGPAPLGLYDPFVGASWIPITPPPLPGVCGVGKKPTGNSGGTAQGKGNPCANGGPSEVPEPGTWLLVVSGLAAMYWKSRQKLART